MQSCRKIAHEQTERMWQNSCLPFGTFSPVLNDAEVLGHQLSVTESLVPHRETPNALGSPPHLVPHS